MENDVVKEWLDALVNNVEQMRALHMLNSSIRAYAPRDYIFLPECIEIVADIMSLELLCERKENCEIPYRYEFTYRGIKFLDYRKEPIREKEGSHV